jgi:hypothetical protein
LLSTTSFMPGVGPMPAAEVRAAQATTTTPLVPNATVSTIPANGDLNPYGVAFVPKGFPKGGTIKPGDVLVSNFNAKSNLQGTGTTIVAIDPTTHTQSLFFQGQSGLGLTTALGVLKRGFVIVGNLPSTDGTSATAQPGSLLVIDRNGKLVDTLTNPTAINGPWDLTIIDQGSKAQVFVSNVLSGTVSRLDLLVGKKGVTVQRAVTIASGYTHHGDPNAFEIGPTGLAFDPTSGILYVASTGDNAIFAVPGAARSRTDRGTGTKIFADNTVLHGPLGMALAPGRVLDIANGDAVNADPNFPSQITAITTKGQFLLQAQLDPKPDAPFGIALNVSQTVGQSTMALVNDNQNTLELFAI